MPELLTISPYDPRWPEEFEAESRRIHASLGPLALRIDHVGSTSVPGLAGKPVIDIQISVEKLHPMDPYQVLLEQIGYTHVPHADDVIYPFLHRPETWPHTHHVHVCQAGDSEERRHLAFRDYLRDHPELTLEYAQVKRDLVRKFSAETFESRNAYAEAKSVFIAPVLERALKEGYPV